MAGNSLNLNDELALVRTRLANERTLLAHLRTGLGLVAIGITPIVLTDSVMLNAFGFVLMIAGVLVGWFGLKHYRRTGEVIRQMEIARRAAPQ